VSYSSYPLLLLLSSESEDESWLRIKHSALTIFCMFCSDVTDMVSQLVSAIVAVVFVVGVPFFSRVLRAILVSSALMVCAATFTTFDCFC